MHKNCSHFAKNGVYKMHNPARNFPFPLLRRYISLMHLRGQTAAHFPHPMHLE